MEASRDPSGLQRLGTVREFLGLDRFAVLDRPHVRFARLDVRPCDATVATVVQEGNDAIAAVTGVPRHAGQPR